MYSISLIRLEMELRPADPSAAITVSAITSPFLFHKLFHSSSNQWGHLQIAADKVQHSEHFEELEFMGFKKWVLSQLLG